MMEDTIAAIATPIGEGGIAIIRVSGKLALEVADRCFQPKGRSSTSVRAAASHTIQYGHVVQDGQVVDEVLVSVMLAPRTFTREDTVEIACHGGLLVSKCVLDAVLASGARLAEPGEFAKRAFLNGRIDLTQAEAVADVIHSGTRLALAAANEQLAGKLSLKINRLRDDLLNLLAHVEAHIDFPDEDIEPDQQSQLQARLQHDLSFMEELLATADEGRVLRKGIRAAILGRPNAGKSSLLNHLLGEDRAIVSAQAGTTRDTIEETANLRGIPVVFIDTAGLRDTTDDIEKEGVRRSVASLDKAELILHVVDRSLPWEEEDARWIGSFESQRTIVVLNKSDLPRAWHSPKPLSHPEVEVSCANGDGLETLKDAIQAKVWKGGLNSESLQVMINARHQDALRRSHGFVQDALAGFQENRSLELIAVDLRAAVQAVGEIVGKTATEDLLDVIFGQFCLGK